MIGDRLTLFQIAILSEYSVAMAGGQLLFKFAADRSVGVSLVDRLLFLLQDGYFLSALILYAGLTLLWVWILTFTPLSRAYPFVALAFVLTPLLAGLMLGETISLRLLLGLLAILCGLYLVAG